MRHKDKMTILAFFFGGLLYLVMGQWRNLIIIAIINWIVYSAEQYAGLDRIFFVPAYFAINVFIIIHIRQLADKEEKELENIKKSNEERRQRIRNMINDSKK